MRRSAIAIVALGLMLVSACGAADSGPVATQPVPPCDPEAVFSTFELGAVWSYETRPGEEGSTFTVRCIEDADDGRTVHIEVGGISIETAGGIADSIGHLPVAEDSLAEVIVERVGFDEGAASQSFIDGYTSWREASGGVWKLPLAEVLDEVEATVGAG